jgi:hypothetical protein
MLGMPASSGAVSGPTISQQSQFRSLMSEMGVVMAPPLLTPADSLGWSGFHLSVDTAFTAVSHNDDFWQKGVENVSSGMLSTIHVTARKGLWFPVPAFEIGAGGSYLVDSNIYAVEAYAKFAIQEGFHGWAIPSIALRGAVSHLLGTPQLELTVVSTDLTISKSFGVAGTARFVPYVGANLLIIIPRSQVIDTTPNVDAFQQATAAAPMARDLNSNVVLPDQDPILRWRLFFGLRYVWSIVALTAEFSWAFCNHTATDCTVDNPTQVSDRSQGQAQVSISAGVLF